MHHPWKSIAVVVVCIVACVLPSLVSAGCGCCTPSVPSQTPSICIKNPYCDIGNPSMPCTYAINHPGSPAPCNCSCVDWPAGLGFSAPDNNGGDAFRHSVNTKLGNSDKDKVVAKWPITLRTNATRVSMISLWAKCTDGNPAFDWTTLKIELIVPNYSTPFCLWNWSDKFFDQKDTAIDVLDLGPSVNMGVLQLTVSIGSGCWWDPIFGTKCNGGGNPWAYMVSLGWTKV